MAEPTRAPAGLASDPGAVGEPASRPARVCIVSYEFAGPTRTGGIGTAYSSLAEALADAGHEVTVLFTGWAPGEDDTFQRWVRHHGDRGIELDRLERWSEGIEAGQINAARSYEAYRWLRERDAERPFDVVHFPETLGHGYYAILARRQGLALGATTIAIGTHSSTTWVLETNGIVCQGVNDYADDFIERRCVELADAVISPSAYLLDWMRSRGWEIAKRCFVQQYVLPRELAALRETGTERGGAGGPTEVVFFGRLEHRKGLRLFCDALDELAVNGAPGLEVTFLGGEALVDGAPAGEYIARRASGWPWRWRILDGFGRREALAHLRGPGRRLAVMPSLADNSPNTVYEALALEIPFIASRIGGTAELIAEADLDRCTFDPGEPGELAARLRGALAAPRLEPVRPAIDPDENRQAHVAWHERIAGANDRRVGQPEADEHATRRAAGALAAAARTGSAAPADPPYVPCGAAGATLDAEAIATLAGVADRTSADFVAPAVRITTDQGEHVRVPVGGPPVAGLLRRPFGDLAFLARREALERLGGFDRDVDPAWQAHELLCRAAIAGARIEPVPEPLAGPVPSAEAGPLAVTRAREPALAIAAAYREASPELLAQLPALAQQLSAIHAQRDREFTHLYENRFGRLTIPIRKLAFWARRARASLRRGP